MARIGRPKMDESLLTAITVLVGWFVALTVFNAVTRFNVTLPTLLIELVIGASAGGLLMGLIRPDAELASAAVGGAVAGAVIIGFLVLVSFSRTEVDQPGLAIRTAVESLPIVLLGGAFAPPGMLIGTLIRRRRRPPNPL